MKTIIAVSVVLCYCVVVAQAQDSFTAFGSTVMYARPDPSRWNLVHNGIDSKSNAYLLMFQRKPIKDAEGRAIEPVIAVICEKVADASDVIRYSIAKRMRMPFSVKKMMAPQSSDFAYGNAIGYEGEYTIESVPHKVFVAHMRHKEVGVQVICDSTDGVFDKVEGDMRNFLRSLTFKD